MNRFLFGSYRLVISFWAVFLVHSLVSAQEESVGGTSSQTIEVASDPNSTESGPIVKSIEPFTRREPVIPIHLPDYELTTLDVAKEVVFHVGDETYVSRVPILVYVPVNRAGRAEAVDQLVEARAILLKSAAAKEITTADLAALRDLIERSLVELRAPLPVSPKPGVGSDQLEVVQPLIK